MMQVLLLDIEGTTTSISFVYDTLFPYARARLEAARAGHGPLAATWSDPAWRPAWLAVAPVGSPPSLALAAQRALDLMAADVKDTGLKLLQGLIWQAGYQSQALTGHLFPDVHPALARAVARGIRVAIYSSGSVAAQRLLFGYSVAGDLRPLITAYFDTTTGPKREAASYSAIAAALAVSPDEILFATDNPLEAEASIAAGIHTWLAVRPGNAPLPPQLGVPTFTSLGQLPGLG